jgi:putative mRNA 3-end processing factor
LSALLSFTNKGIYCAAGGFYIDPWKPVERAIITHAHSDHAKAGHGHYLCTPDTKPLLELRLGNQYHYQTLPFGEAVFINGVKISLHPAGHIIGSAQVRVEANGEIWVFSGDYKPENDGLSTPFEPVPCHTFITESTFGLPIYQWKPQAVIFEDIRLWMEKNRSAGKTSVLLAYSLGKAQRLIQGLHQAVKKIYVHGAIWNTQVALTEAGWQLPAVEKIVPGIEKADFLEGLVIAPPSAEGSSWMNRFNPYAIGVCSGWMQVRGNARRQNVDGGFALSDHADWNGLLSSIKATGAEKVFATHGFQSVLARYLNEQGIAAAEVKTEYGEEEEVV